MEMQKLIEDNLLQCLIVKSLYKVGQKESLVLKFPKCNKIEKIRMRRGQYRIKDKSHWTSDVSFGLLRGSYLAIGIVHNGCLTIPR